LTDGKVGRTVHLDHVALRVIEVEGKLGAVVEGILDGQPPLLDLAVPRLQVPRDETLKAV
jgi:hypothetical protein